jgi:hypothetical protein
LFECLDIDERRGRGGPLKRAEGHKVAELGFTTLSGWSPECVYFLNLDGVEPVGT